MSGGKAITLIEIDYEKYRQTSFETLRTGSEPIRFPLAWGSGGTVIVASNPNMPSGKSLLVSNPGSESALWWRWTRPDAMKETDSHILLRVPEGVTADPGIVVRGSATSETGYIVKLTSDGTSVTIVKMVNGTPETLATEDFEWTTEENIWIAVSAIDYIDGVSIRAKVWKGEFENAPGGYTIFAEDETDYIDADGWCGPFLSAATSSFHVGYMITRSLFNNDTETIRYAMPTNYLPVEFDAIPNLVSVNLSPSAVDLGETLGIRGTLTVKFKDHKFSDDGEGYENGTYWGKRRARFPYIENSNIRLRRGLLGMPLEEFETKHYIIQSFDGPTPDGEYTIISQDPLKLTDGTRAQVPRISNGFLLDDIASGASTCTLSPSGIGDHEYPESGLAAIGGAEVVAFTRVGDVLTITRGQHGTTAVAHTDGDRVQLCQFYDAVKASDALNHLLTEFAGVPQEIIPLDAWHAEDDNYLQLLYTRLIAEPTRLDRVINDLIKQAGLAVGYDDEARLIRLRVLRGINFNDEVITEGEFIQGSLTTKEQPKTRISQVWVSFGVKNPLQPLDEPQNYRSTDIRFSEDLQNLYGSARIEKIYANWIPAFGRQTAQRVGDLHLGRFSRPPRHFSFKLFKYAGRAVNLLEGYRLKWFANQSQIGGNPSAPIQIVRRITDANHIAVEAEEMLVAQFDPVDLVNRVITIDSNIQNVHLPSVHNSIFPPLTDQDVIDGVNLKVIFATGTILSSSSNTLNSFEVGTDEDWPAGFQITIDWDNSLRGAGGRGGNGRITGTKGTNGQNGGTAFYTRFPVIIDFGSNADCWGGGGGGGGGYYSGIDGYAGGGGGGAGIDGGARGIGVSTAGSGANGQNGTADKGGKGASGAGVVGRGGNGGDPGQDGAPGINAFNAQPSGLGGSGGPAFDGWSYVTVNSGACDIKGSQIN